MYFPLVYVVVINWNGLAHLRDCFDTLLRSDYPNFRVLMVDNASTDGSPQEVMQRYGRRVEVMMLQENRGWGPGNNAGIRHAFAEGADFVLLLNNDTWTHPTAITELVACAMRKPDAAALAPKMLLFDTPSVLNSLGVCMSRIGAAWDIGIGELDGREHGEMREVPAVCGGAMFLRTTALRGAGLIDEEFGIYYDDVDLCLRLWQRGHQCLTCPSAHFGHKFSASLGGSEEYRRRKHFLTERNRLRCLLLNMPTPLLWRYLPSLLWAEARIVGSALRAGETWRAGAQARAWGALARQAGSIRRARRGRFSRVYAKKLGEMMLPSPMFCPPLALPRAGVYPAAGEWNAVSTVMIIALPPQVAQVKVTSAGRERGMVYDGSVAAMPAFVDKHDVALSWNGTILKIEGDAWSVDCNGAGIMAGAMVQCRDAEGKILDLHELVTPHLLPADLAEGQRA